MSMYQTRIQMKETPQNKDIINLMRALKKDKKLGLYIERAIALSLAVDKGIMSVGQTVAKDWQSSMSVEAGELASLQQYDPHTSKASNQEACEGKEEDDTTLNPNAPEQRANLSDSAAEPTTIENIEKSLAQNDTKEEQGGDSPEVFKTSLKIL